MNRQELLLAATRIILEASRLAPELPDDEPETRTASVTQEIRSKRRVHPVLSGLIWAEILKKPEY